MLGERLLQPLRLFRAAPFGKPLPHAVHRRCEPVLVDGLHQIIDRLGIERPQRMLAISGDEHEQRRLDVHQTLDHRETVETRHLDVEEDEIGLVGLDLPDRFAAVRCRGDDLDVIEGLQPELQPLSREWFVVDQNGPDGH